MIRIMIRFCSIPWITALFLLSSCATPHQRLSGKTDIPLLLPGERYASWKIDEASFDQYRYYMISKYNAAGKSITILASDGEDNIASPTDKKVMIPEFGMVRYRRCSVGGDEELPRFETDPLTRENGHGGKVYYIVRVTTADGDQEAMMKNVKWAAPGSKF
jgi:hypothetical protein